MASVSFETSRETDLSHWYIIDSGSQVNSLSCAETPLFHCVNTLFGWLSLAILRLTLAILAWVSPVDGVKFFPTFVENADYFLGFIDSLDGLLNDWMG